MMHAIDKTSGTWNMRSLSIWFNIWETTSTFFDLQTDLMSEDYIEYVGEALTNNFL